MEKDRLIHMLPEQIDKTMESLIGYGEKLLQLRKEKTSQIFTRIGWEGSLKTQKLLEDEQREKAKLALDEELLKKNNPPGGTYTGGESTNNNSVLGILGNNMELLDDLTSVKLHEGKTRTGKLSPVPMSNSEFVIVGDYGFTFQKPEDKKQLRFKSEADWQKWEADNQDTTLELVGVPGVQMTLRQWNSLNSNEKDLILAKSYKFRDEELSKIIPKYSQYSEKSKELLRDAYYEHVGSFIKFMRADITNFQDVKNKMTELINFKYSNGMFNKQRSIYREQRAPSFLSDVESIWFRG